MKKNYAIINMPPPKFFSQLYTLQGRIQAIYYFVVSLLDWLLPFKELLKK